MENVVKVSLYRHNGVLSPLCLLYLYHLWHDCGYKCLLSLETGMDEKVVSEDGGCREEWFCISVLLLV